MNTIMKHSTMGIISGILFLVLLSSILYESDDANAIKKYHDKWWHEVNTKSPNVDIYFTVPEKNYTHRRNINIVEINKHFIIAKNIKGKHIVISRNHYVFIEEK